MPGTRSVYVEVRIVLGWGLGAFQAVGEWLALMTRCVTLWVSPKALLLLFLQTAALLPTELKGGKSGRARSCRETFGVWCCPVLSQRDS